jgi:formiminoglutamase
MLKHFKAFTNLDHVIRHRKGEIKLGEKFKLLEKNTKESLKKHYKSGARFALLGIPESIGVQANLGTGGAENSWDHFLLHFANQQSNRFFDGSSILCLGQVETEDLQKRAAELSTTDQQYFTRLRSLCGELDQRVSPIIEQIAMTGLIPIIIGGGHNNSYPILMGLTKGLGSLQGISCINFDAHADFRPLEGRHSGNGFSYAFYQGYLQRYYVYGLNESYTSEAMLKNMDLESDVAYELYQPGARPDISSAVEFTKQANGPIGLEIDLDVMSFIPASAYAVSGYSVDQIRVLIKDVTTQIKPVYLHLTEGQVTENSRDALIVGKSLSTLVLDFVKSYSF